MNTQPKYLHIAKRRRGGEFVVGTLCGRRVGLMSTTDEARATCTKCLAESLAITTQRATA